MRMFQIIQCNNFAEKKVLGLGKFIENMQKLHEKK